MGLFKRLMAFDDLLSRTFDLNFSFFFLSSSLSFVSREWSVCVASFGLATMITIFLLSGWSAVRKPSHLILHMGGNWGLLVWLTQFFLTNFFLSLM